MRDFALWLVLFWAGTLFCMAVLQPETRRHLLLVDDDENVLRDVASSLERLLGCTTAAYTDPRQAIARAAEVRFDCAVLDMDMPILNGLEVARALRDVRPDLPIVFLTGSAEAFSQAEIDALDTQGVLAKPLRPAVLAAHLRRVLA